ncbi:MAG: acyl--CoA ligase [Chromatiales bacterium]|jgi:fatty-acyl-CoA synthase|nr:acyl--CoA ligase [Chromatiales bacterium]
MQPPRSRTLFDLLDEIASTAPDVCAVVATEESLTYGELRARAASVATRLRNDGLGRGQRVGVMINNRPQWLEIFFGVSALGAIVVPFSTWSTRSELEFLVEDSGVEHVFTIDALGDRRFVADFRAIQQTPAGARLGSIVEVHAGADTFNPYAVYRNTMAEPLPLTPGVGASASDTLVLLYTSGSSARPKSVPLQHFATVENGFNIGERMGLTAADKVFVPVPLFWSYGAVNALPAIVSHGATMVIQPRFEPSEALDIIEREQCTALYTLPAMSNALMSAPGFAASRTRSLRTGLMIGSPEDVKRCALELGVAEICNIYGSTETYGNCCVTPHDWPLEGRAQTQGPPLPGVAVRIRNAESGAFCGTGEVGSIEVRGYLTPGYAGNSAQHNGAVFTDDGYFRTGDLGALTREGTLQYAGRSSEMIKRSGINVSPVEIEDVLQRHPDVGMVGVTGTDDAHLGEAIVAFVVSRPDATPNAAALIAYCREHLSSYKLPDRMEICAELPLTPTGKLMRRKLRAWATRITSQYPSIND